MPLHDKNAADLNCKWCAKIYSAIQRRGGNSWFKQIMHDTGLRRSRLRRHLKYLLAAKLLEHDFFGYRIRVDV